MWYLNYSLFCFGVACRLENVRAGCFRKGRRLLHGARLETASQYPCFLPIYL
ncbi:hypothetical protein ABID59_004284 [Bradyrhizobium sp. S3.3.6]